MLQKLHSEISLLFRRKDKETYRILYNILGFLPHDVSIYKTALTHSSHTQNATNKKNMCNERLEFLGDAIIDAIVSDLLYSRYQKEREGFLTKSRSNLVRRETLNEVAISLGLDKIVMTHNTGRQHNNYVYGNAFEAFVGAIYLDRGYKHCKRFLLERVFDKIVNVEKTAVSDVNFKSRLIEWGQKNHHTVVFRTKANQEKGGRDFRCTILIDNLEVGHGIGTSKKEAEQRAAQSVSHEPSDEACARLLDRIDKMEQ